MNKISHISWGGYDKGFYGIKNYELWIIKHKFYILVIIQIKNNLNLHQIFLMTQIFTISWGGLDKESYGIRYFR